MSGVGEIVGYMKEVNDMQLGPAIGHQAAEQLIKAGEAAAADVGMHLAICVVDDSGDLVRFVKMDRCPKASIQIAQDKAFSAVNFKQPTHKFAEQIALGLVQPTRIHDRLVTLWGGFPLVRDDGHIVGGIGVSGGTVEDLMVCRAMLEVGGFRQSELSLLLQSLEQNG